MSGDYRAFWSHPYRDFYIPVTYTAWTAIAELSRDPRTPDARLQPEAFRTVNIVIHATNTVLVFWLIQLLIGAFWPAVLAAALFSVHPMQVESVVWISELRGLLATLFSLSALLLHCRYRQTGSARIVFAALAWMSFGLAVLSKPSVTTLPIVVVAVDRLFYRATLPRRWWLTPLTWMMLGAPMMIVAKSVQPDAAVEFIPTLMGRIGVAADALTFYCGKLVMPWPLSPSYGRTPQAVLVWRLENALWTIPFAIASLAWRFRSRLPGLAVGATVAVSSLAPVLGLIPFKGQNFSTVADRYMYLPLFGAALAMAAFVTRAGMTRTRWVLAASAVGALSVLNIRYQAIWQDDLTLWRHASRTYPKQPRVHNNYGAALQVVGLQEEAIGQFDEALQARPDFADAYCNRGSSFGQLGRYSDALADQTRAIQLDPTDGGCWYNRAVTLLKLGRYQGSLSDAAHAEQRGYHLPVGFVEAVQRRLNASSR